MNSFPLISLPIDTALCDTACRLGGHSTPAEAVQQALQWYVECLHNHPTPPQDWQTQSIIDLFGKIDYDKTVEFHSPRSANLASISPPNSGGETSVPPSQFQTFLEILKESGKKDYDYKQQRQLR